MAERNPQVPHSIQSLLYVERNRNYRGYKPELIKEGISGDLREFIICAECKGICRRARRVGRKSLCGICVTGKYKNVDRRLENRVASLNSKCPLKLNGCNWAGLLGKIEEHMTVCPRLLIECQFNCGIVSERETCKPHSQEVCQLRKIKCHHCNEQLQAFRYKQHVRNCNNHPDTELPCPYLELGCDVITLRKDKDIHLTENMIGHQRLMLEQLNQMRERNQLLEQLNEQHKNKTEKQKNRNEKQDTVNNQQEIVNYEHEVVKHEQEIVNQEQERCNEHLKNRNQKQEQVKNHLRMINYEQKLSNENQAIVNAQQQKVNHEQEVVNFEQKIVNYQIKTARRKGKCCQIICTLLGIIVTLLAAVIGIAVAVSQQNQITQNSKRILAINNRPLYLNEYIPGKGIVLPGIELIHSLKNTGYIHGANFYLAQCKLRPIALVTNTYKGIHTEYFVERLNGDYNNSVSCRISYSYATYGYLDDIKPTGIFSSVTDANLSVGGNYSITANYWKYSDREVVVRAYFDTEGE